MPRSSARGGQRWPPAKKVQRGGEVTRDSMITYLGSVSRELASMESLEILATCGPGLALGKGDEEFLGKVGGLMEYWQVELMEHHGWETGFGRSQVRKWSQDKTDDDEELQRVFGKVQLATQWAMAVAGQERQLRTTLQTGPYDPSAPADDADETIPRRTARAAGELNSTGPIPRDVLLRFFEDTRRLLLSLETRELLAGLAKEYSSWAADKRGMLQHCALLKWCVDTWETLGYDRRLGQWAVVAALCDNEDDEELAAAQKAHMNVIKAMQIHASMRFPPGTMPKPAGEAGRRVEPFSELERAGLPGRGEAGLQAEGPVAHELLLAYIRRLAELQGGDWGVEIQEVIMESGDMFAADRWRHELMEGFGLTHEYCNLCVVLTGTGANSYSSAGPEDELVAARQNMEEVNGQFKKCIGDALRSRAAAKAKAKAAADEAAKYAEQAAQ